MRRDEDAAPPRARLAFLKRYSSPLKCNSNSDNLPINAGTSWTVLGAGLKR